MEEVSTKHKSFLVRRIGVTSGEIPGDRIPISLCEHVILTNMRNHVSVSLKDISSKNKELARLIVKLTCEISSFKKCAAIHEL